MCLTNAETLGKDTINLKVSNLFPVGKEIDLGERKIKIILTPGHSKESISIIDSENKYIFTGDLIYNGLLLFDDSDAYLKSINRIIENSDSAYRVFGAHGKPEVKYERLTQIKQAIEYYHTVNNTITPVRQINLFGTLKNVYQIDHVSFIDGYTDAFKND